MKNSSLSKMNEIFKKDPEKLFEKKCGMNEKDFQDLLAEIDSMSIEEYNKFHEEALKMKASGISIEENNSKETKMTDKLRELLNDVRTVEGKGIISNTNSFDELQMEIEKLDSINKQQSVQIEELEESIKRMKNNCIDLMKVQSTSISDDYMAGMYNGMAAIHNSFFVDDIKRYCHKNSDGKWEIIE